MIVTIDNEPSTMTPDSRALTNVFICKLVRKANSLRLMLYRLTIHNCMLELLHDGLVDSIALIWCQYTQMTIVKPLTKSSTVHAFFFSTTGVL